MKGSLLLQEKKSKKSKKEPKHSGEVPQITEADFFAKNPEFRSNPPLPPASLTLLTASPIRHAALLRETDA